MWERRESVYNKSFFVLFFKKKKIMQGLYIEYCKVSRLGKH